MYPPEKAICDPVRIEELGSSLGERPQPAVVSALVTFGQLFLAWNAKINLGGVRTGDELIDRHFSDSFAAARFIRSEDRVVDVGSGGGLPVIPMALLRPGARFDLFEPTAKKVAFLRTAVRVLGLGDRVRVSATRLSIPLPVGVAAAFDVACARATFAPAAWIQLGLDLIRDRGQVLVFATSQPTVGCPSPADEFVYGSNRRLLTFRRQVPRGT